jgi:hypothetical protein
MHAIFSTRISASVMQQERAQGSEKKKKQKSESSADEQEKEDRSSMVDAPPPVEILHEKTWRLFMCLNIFCQMEQEFLTQSFAAVKSSLHTQNKQAMIRDLVGSRGAFDRFVAFRRQQLERTYKGRDSDMLEMIQMAAVAIRMDRVQSKSNTREWTVTFHPNIATFYRNDVARIPERWHALTCSSLMATTPPSGLNQFRTTFEANSAGVFSRSFVTTKQNVQLLFRVMSWFLTEDLLRIQLYPWCNSTRSDYARWKHNPHHPFASTLDTLWKQFPFQVIYTDFAKEGERA